MTIPMRLTDKASAEDLFTQSSAHECDHKMLRQLLYGPQINDAWHFALYGYCIADGIKLEAVTPNAKTRRWEIQS